METLIECLHYGTVALAVSTTSSAVGIGEGRSGRAALEAMNIQPKARNDIAKTAILGMALGETAALIGFSVAAMLLIDTPDRTIYTSIAEIGIALAICVSGFVVGIASSLPTQEACLSVARQPFFSKKILYIMILTQSILQTPIIFCFIVAIFIKGQMAYVSSYTESIRLLATGLCIGIGSIGPVIGLGTFAREACRSISINRLAYDRLFSFIIISQALIETPMIFALAISVLLAFSACSTTTLMATACLAAGACMAVGTLGTGISSGRIAAAACRQMAFSPDLADELSRASMLGQGLIDTSAIYTFIVACTLIFWH